MPGVCIFVLHSSSTDSNWKKINYCLCYATKNCEILFESRIDEEKKKERQQTFIIIINNI
jgi:hypothetical protein